MAIGQVAARTGLAVSAIRFYEDRGLVTAVRGPSGHRRFRRSEIRRISFILTCQKLGYSLAEIQAQLEGLPGGRTPTEADWQQLALRFRRDIDDRIAKLALLKEKLDGCIGCGCLSLKNCEIWNTDDAAATLGTGPRYLQGDTPDDLSPDDL